jgi:hypothetical protein
MRTLFLADQFDDTARTARERNAGGAELTDAAAIAACPWPITCRKLSELRRGEIGDYELVVVANSQSARPEQLAELAASARYVAFEHDLRICRWRGNFVRAVDPWHRRAQRCWCPHLDQRSFFANAAGLIFLTSFQERIYRQNPFFACAESRVLGSSLFDPASLSRAARESAEGSRSGTCVFASPNRIKGYETAAEYCRARGIVPAVIANLKPQEVLSLFAGSERFVYLPIGPEWAGRMVVEARLLGCEVVVNANVGVAGEPFWRGSSANARDFLARGPDRFWSLVAELARLPERPRRIVSPTPAARAAELLLHGLRPMPPWLMPFEVAPPEPSIHAPW